MNEYSKEIVAFMNHAENSAVEMLRSLDENDYDEKFDIVVSTNGKSLRIELCAQIHQDFMYFLQQVEIEFWEE